MEYKKTKSLLTIALLFGVIFSFALVSAQDDTVVIDTSHYNVWDNFLYKLSKTIGLFTAAGQARTCATYATLTIDPASSGTYYPQQLLTQSGWTGPSALINVFDSEWHFLGEYKSEINQAINLQGDGIIEVYGCPYLACTSDADCVSNGYGDTCNYAYGSCYYDENAPDHSTNVYTCTDGNWVLSSSVIYGQEHFCIDSTYNNYISQSGVAGCYTSAPEGWCEDNGGSIDCSTLSKLQCNNQEGICVYQKNGIFDPGKCVNVEGNGGTETKSLSDVQKISLTKEEIGKATTQELIGSVCITSKECLPREGYGSESCVRLSSLSADGILTNDEAKNTLDKANTVFISTIGGGILGAAGGLLACALGVGAGGAIIVASGGAAAPAVIPIAGMTCATLTGAGALIGAGAGFVLSDVVVNIDSKDPLVKAIKAKDTSQVGLCVAEDKGNLSQYTGWAAFVKITGDEGVDGLIIILGGLTLLGFLFGGKR